MRVLVACEWSGKVREAFRARGHTALSCDFEPSALPGPHAMRDVRDLLGGGWDMMIAFPPCRYLAGSGLHWNKVMRGRSAKTEQALDFVRELMEAPIKRIAIENPVGLISTRIRPPDQIIQPFDFGHDVSKKTCLWLKALPALRPTCRVEPRETADGKERWGNQTDSGQDRNGNYSRAKQRGTTFQGIADAMAEQWGRYG